MSEQNVLDSPSQGRFEADEAYEGGDSSSEDFSAGPGAPGAGQSKSSRRRRRKRRNKVGGESVAGVLSEAGPAPFVMQGESLALAASSAPILAAPEPAYQAPRVTRQSAPQPAAQTSSLASQSANPQGSANPGAAGTGKRWKEEVSRSRTPAHPPRKSWQ